MNDSFDFLILQNLLRREPLKLVDGGQSQRTFVYIKDAIEAVLLMIVRYSSAFLLSRTQSSHAVYISELCILFVQENPSRSNGQIFNVGNPNNEVTVKQLAEMMTEVGVNCGWFDSLLFLCFC